MQCFVELAGGNWLTVREYTIQELAKQADIFVFYYYYDMSCVFNVFFLHILLVYFMPVMHAYILIFTFKSAIAMHCNWRAIVMLELKAFYLFI